MKTKKTYKNHCLEFVNVPASVNPTSGLKKTEREREIDKEQKFTKRLQWLFVITQHFVKALRRVVVDFFPVFLKCDWLAFLR